FIPSSTAAVSSSLNSPLSRTFLLVEGDEAPSPEKPFYQSVLTRSGDFCDVPVTFSDSVNHELGNVTSRVLVDGVEFGSAVNSSTSKARRDASEVAYGNLKEICFTLRVRQIAIQDEVGKETLTGAKRMPAKDQLGEDNVGSKLMRLMGWSGGALGKTGEGITKAIEVSDVLGRQGFGFKTGSAVPEIPRHVFKRKVTDILRQYINSESVYDLKFSSEFSKEDRKEIHLLSRRFNLKSRSHGTQSRFLVLSKKVERSQLIAKLLREGSNDKYTLIPPSSAENPETTD
ncbi:unnamed protein product, partial [Cyprideis torosa]